MVRFSSATSAPRPSPTEARLPYTTSLRDGSRIRVDRITVGDAPLIADAFARLGAESRRLRFLTSKPTLSEAELRYLSQVDGHRHEALGAIDLASRKAIGVARFVRDEEEATRAEVAVTVVDDWQHRGVGTLLLELLTDRAREEGIQSFTALVSGDNRNMQGLLDHLGDTVHVNEVGSGISEYEIEVASKGLGKQLQVLLRAAAAGHWQMPPRLCELLRALVPFHLPRG